MPRDLKLIQEAVVGETEDRLFYQYLIDSGEQYRGKEIGTDAINEAIRISKQSIP